MATLVVGGLASFTSVFGTAGTAAFSAATFAFSTLAAAIDNFLLFPALFPPEDIKGDRIEDFALSTAAEGSARNTVLGEQNRVGAQVIWQGAITERSDTESGGKGGGGGPDVTTYTYFCNVAIEVTDGTIASIDRIWADGNILYVNPDKPALVQTTVTSDEIAAIAGQVTYRGPNVRLQAPAAVFSSGLFKVGSVITVTGFAEPQLNSGHTFVAGDWPATYTQVIAALVTAGTHTLRWKIFDIGSGANPEIGLRAWALDSTGAELYPLDRSNIATNATAAGPLASRNWYSPGLEAVGEDVTCTADTASYHPGWVETVTIYDGTQQPTDDPVPVDPLIDAEETGPVPIFVNRSYITLGELNLTEFGNRVPNFVVQVNEQASKPLSTAISDVLTSAGLISNQYDVTALSGITMEGYNIVGIQQPRSALQPLLMTYNVAVQEDNDKLTFYLKENATEVALDATLMGTGEAGSPGTFTDQDERDRPTRINVKYIDPATDLQTGTQAYRKVDSSEQGAMNIDFQVTMTATDAQCRARRVLWASWSNSRRFTTSIAPRYYELLPGDVATFNYSLYDSEGTAITAYVRVFILTTTRGENGLIEIEGVVEDPQPFISQLCETDGPTGFSTSVVPTDPPEAQLEIIDLAPLKEEHINTPGAYLAGCLVDPEAGWNGAKIWRATDHTSPAGGVAFTSGTFTAWKDLIFETTSGASATVLADGNIHTLDRKNTVTVDLNHGSLASITKDELNERGNQAVLGDEVIAFQTVESLGNNSYTLSNLLRGLRGTKVTGHVAGERFVLTNSLGFSFFETHSVGSAGPYWNFKVVPLGQAAGEVSAIETVQSATLGVVPQSFQLTGRNSRPAPVCNVTATRDASNNLTIYWQRTTRSLVTGIASTRPLNESFAQFMFNVYTDATSTPVLANIIYNPIQILPMAPQGFYSMVVTAAQQTAIGVTPGNPVYVEGLQLSSVGGPAGRIRERFTL